MIPPILNGTQIEENLRNILEGLHNLNLTPQQYNEIAKIIVMLCAELQLNYKTLGDCIEYGQNALEAFPKDNQDSRDIILVLAAGINAASTSMLFPKGLSLLEKVVYRSIYKSKHLEVQQTGEALHNHVLEFINEFYPKLPTANKEPSLN